MPGLEHIAQAIPSNSSKPDQSRVAEAEFIEGLSVEEAAWVDTRAKIAATMALAMSEQAVKFMELATEFPGCTSMSEAMAMIELLNKHYIQSVTRFAAIQVGVLKADVELPRQRSSIITMGTIQ